MWGSRGPQLIAQPDWNPPLKTDDENHFGAGLTLAIPLGPTENVVRIVEAPTPPTPVLEVPELAVLTEVMRGAGQLFHLTRNPRTMTCHKNPNPTLTRT